MTDGLFTTNIMPFLYGGEEGDAGNCPCNWNEIGLSDDQHADKEQKTRQFIGFGVQELYPMFFHK